MRTLDIFILCLFAINCYSQITTITTKVEEEPKEIQAYDSLETLNFKNVLSHKGQTIFIKGSSYAKMNGYPYYFFTDTISEPRLIEHYIYKPTAGKIEGTIVSNYSELVGKYYKIQSIYTAKYKYEGTIYWVKLIGEDNHPFYLRFYKDTYIYDFITQGYYEKMKQIFVGKEFYSIGPTEYQKVDNNEKVELPNRIKLKCIDIAVNIGENGPAFAVLENEKYGKIKAEITKKQKLYMLISFSDYNKYLKKYGTKFGKYVAEREIVIGMNKNMVKDAWGDPDHINTTQGTYGVHEQWVYGKRYIYFKNGIVTSKQY
nr:MAG TPA: SmpA / OmlA family [Caudoviricetes sp.]